MTFETLIARIHALDEAILACTDFAVETKLFDERAALILEARDAGYIRMFDGTFQKVADFNLDTAR